MRNLIADTSTKSGVGKYKVITPHAVERDYLSMPQIAAFGTWVLNYHMHKRLASIYS